MAAGNTQFKVDHGLFVQGVANVTGAMTVGGDLQVAGNLAFSGTVGGDYLPSLDNTYALGNTTNRWILYSSTGSFSEAVTMSKALDVTQTLTANSVLPSANNRALGSATRKWNLTANSVAATTLSTTSTGSIGSSLSVTTSASIGTTLSVTGNTSIGGAELAITSTTGANVNIANTLAFDQNLLFLDAVNNRIGIKNAAPSSVGVVTITGDVVFNGNNTGIKLFSSANTGSVANASITVQGNTTVGTLVFNAMDISNTTQTGLGGLLVTSTNSTATSNTLKVTQNAFLYKTGNVAHSGNFGIYNAAGTRVGP
jgi:hypothetical protein